MNASSARALQAEHIGGGAGKGVRAIEARLNDWAREVDAGALLFALGVAAGAAIYLLAAEEPDGLALTAAALTGALAALVARFYGAPVLIRLALFTAAGVGLGLAAGKLRVERVAAPTLSHEVGPTQIEGWVTAIDAGANGPRLRILTHAISGLDASQWPKTVRATHRLSLNVGPGDFVSCRVVLRPPPRPSAPGDYDFQRQAWFEGLGGVGYVQGRCKPGGLGPPSNWLAAQRLKLAKFRRGLGETVAEAAGPRAGGFAAALVTGDRSFMAIEDREALRSSGLAHLLAVSGLHMGIVGGLVFLALRRGLALIEPLALRVPVGKLAAIGALTASLIYLALSGASVATQRAFITAAVFFTAILADRPAFSVRSYSIALAGVALLQPEAVLSPGYQMSFAAAGALIALYEAWNRRRATTPRSWASGPAFAAQSLAATSVVAAAATAPFTLHHFARIAPLGLFANLAAMPLVAFVAAPAAGLALLLAPFGHSEIGLRLFGFALEGVLAVAHAFARPSAGAGAPLPQHALVWFVAALALALLTRNRMRLALVAICVAGGAVTAALARPADLFWAPSGDVYVRAQSGRYERHAFADGRGLAPLNFADLEPSSRCGEPTCRIESAAGLITLIQAEACAPPDGAVAALSLQMVDRSRCPNTLGWPEASGAGGLKITLRRDGGFGVSTPPRCGARPWTACHEDHS